MPLLQQCSFLKEFHCLGDRCEDTCCKGWGMQIDAPMVEKYRQQAPELLNAVATGEAALIMRRDPETDYCVKFDNGWCGIHKQYGSDFLGDACHFFPRITRQLGNMALQTASISCPEIMRLIINAETSPFNTEEVVTNRLPASLKNYLPPALEDSAALNIHSAFLNAVSDEHATAEHLIARLHSVAQSLENIEIGSWPAAASFYLANADGRLMPPEENSTDFFNLFYALAGLIQASAKTKRPRLEDIISTIKSALDLPQDFTVDTPLSLSAGNLQHIAQLHNIWEIHGLALQPALKRWLQAQLSVAFFPFSGFGHTLSQRIAIIGIRLATVKLAFMAYLHANHSLDQANIVRIMQSLARFMDHLADPTLSLKIYEEAGWLKPARLRGLLGDK